MRIAGSGALHFLKDRKWIRNLLRVVKAYDRGQMSPRAVADHLASLNNEVHLRVADKSVGPRCIVAWRNRKGGVHKGGGAEAWYTGTTRDATAPFLPIIGNGKDITALLQKLQPHAIKAFAATRAGTKADSVDEEELNAAIARLPDKPDENLR